MAQQNNRGRQQRIIIIFVVVALLLLVGGAFAILGDDDKPKNTQPERPKGKVVVPVASRNIQLGERISSLMIRPQYLDPDKVPDDAILRSDYFIGRYAVEPIAEATYFKNSNISAPDVNGGYSALAKPGMRVVVINANQIPGAIGTLRVGDHIDLLSIGSADAVSGATGGGGGVSKDQLRYEYMKGGTQPGEPPRRNAPKNAGGMGNDTLGLTASLIAENVEVMRVPTRGRDSELVVLQMNPRDAHVTTLMVAAGASLRAIFRPSNDNERLTIEKEVQVTTRMPKPEPDPDRVAMILGTARRNARPDSTRFESANINADYGKENQLANPKFNDISNSQAPVQVITRDLQLNQVYE